MWRKSRSCTALFSALLGATISLAHADEAPTAKSPAAQSAADASPVTRADLAAAYLRLEQAYFANPPQGEQIATINRGFDQATMSFFLGRNAEAIRAIDQLTESLPAQQHPADQQAISSLKVTPEPAVWQLDSDASRTLRVQSVYQWSAELGEVALEAHLLAADGESVETLPVKVRLAPTSEVNVSITIPDTSSKLKPGKYRIELGLPGKPGITAGHVNVVSSSLDALREENAARLAQIEGGSSASERSLASCRSRNQLLSNEPSVANSAQFLADMHQLSGDVTTEIDALAAGTNPYHGRLGDTWRVFVNGEREIPLRVYAPKAAQTGKALPLLVVLHGMGGDENMFFAAYGAGIIKKIAEERGLLVASPLTYTFGSDIRTVQSLINDLATDYQVDRNRIYVLGHSMGAGATASLARGQADTIAAACCIAGGSLSPAPGTPPILVVIPEIDGVVPPAQCAHIGRACRLGRSAS